MLVPQILAYQTVSFLSAHTSKEDQDKVPTIGVFIPWIEDEKGQNRRRLEDLDREIGALEADENRDGELLNKLYLERANLITTKEPSWGLPRPVESQPSPSPSLDAKEEKLPWHAPR